jgi:hypothetical protein
MRIKIFGFVVALFSASHAIAQESCSPGVYQLTGLIPVYYSVHINGNTALIASLSFTPASDIEISFAGIGTAKPTLLQTWSYAIGDFDGEKYNVSGNTLFEACNWTGAIKCNSKDTASVTLSSVSQTLAGASWAVNCDALMAASQSMGPQSLRKIF